MILKSYFIIFKIILGVPGVGWVTTVPSPVDLASLDLAVYMNVSVTTELPATLLMDVADVNLDGEELGMQKIGHTDRS